MGRLNALQPVMNVDSEAITNDLGQLAKREGERGGVVGTVAQKYN